MTAITVAAACVAGAMICAVIRPQRPELATAVSLAVGCAVMAAVVGQVRTEYLRYGALWNMFADRDGVGRVMLADARRDDAAHILRPLVFRLAPGVPERLRQGLGAALRCESENGY